MTAAELEVTAGCSTPECTTRSCVPTRAPRHLPHGGPYQRVPCQRPNRIGGQSGQAEYPSKGAHLTVQHTAFSHHLSQQAVTALGHGKSVVSPSWVVACHHHWTRLTEGSYPVAAPAKRAAGHPRGAPPTGRMAAPNQTAESASLLGLVDPESELKRVLASAAGGGAK